MRGFWSKDKAEEIAIQLSAVIERVDEGITLSDAGGHFVIFNSKMEEITGYTMEEANRHTNFMEILYPDPGERARAIERIGLVESAGEVHDVESAITSKDGARKTLLISTSLIKHMKQNMFLSVYRDISKHKKLDQLKDDFIGMVSHELRTPLSIVKEGINIVLEGLTGKINESQAKVLSSAKLNIDRLTRIINDLLDISKIEAGKMEMHKEFCDLGRLLKELTLSFGSKMKDRGIKYRLRMPRKGVEACVDKDLIAQVITNLIDNAIKFTKKGSIDISLKDLKCGIRCSVSDTGIGISKDDIPKLFDKFQQFGRAHVPGEKGTGLGLAIAREIVEMHGGNIRVESRLGKGTKITFTLPKKVKNGGDRG